MLFALYDGETFYKHFNVDNVCVLHEQYPSVNFCA